MTTLKSSQIMARRLELRKQLWPELTEDNFWNRKRSTGFATIPRTMPILLQIMDSMSKGKPVSGVYLDLWCRAFDEYVIDLNRKGEMAFSAGFVGQRAELT